MTLSTELDRKLNKTLITITISIVATIIFNHERNFFGFSFLIKIINIQTGRLIIAKKTRSANMINIMFMS